MPDDLDAAIRKKLLALLEETFLDAKGYYLDKGAPYLLTLREIDSKTASTEFEGSHETIAGHINHVIVSLKYTQDFINAKDLSHYNWAEGWEAAVTAIQWEAEIAALKDENEELMKLVSGTGNWLEGNKLDLMMGTIAHCAYHLAIIRQHLVTC